MIEAFVAGGFVVLFIVAVYGYILHCWRAFVRSHYWSYVGEDGPVPEPSKLRFMRRLGRIGRHMAAGSAGA